jgi:hypothetical protein
VGRSFGRCLRNRLLSDCAMRFTTRSFVCTLRRALYWDFLFNYWCLEIFRITIFRTNQGASTIMRKASSWKSKPYPDYDTVQTTTWTKPMRLPFLRLNPEISFLTLGHISACRQSERGATWRLYYSLTGATWKADNYRQQPHRKQSADYIAILFSYTRPNLPFGLAAISKRGS